MPSAIITVFLNTCLSKNQNYEFNNFVKIFNFQLNIPTNSPLYYYVSQH